MTCRDFRIVADSFLSDELLTETNHDVLEHLDTCASCRAEIAVRRHLRTSLRAAFERSPDLQPLPDFAGRLRDQMRGAVADTARDTRFSRRWLMLAASAVLTAGLVKSDFLTQSTEAVDALARDAIGDHWYCALKNRKVRAPVPLEEAAQRFDSVYRVLLTAPPDEIPTPNGVARVIDRHSCAFGTRRFGHVTLQYRDHVVSLLVTAADEQAGGLTSPRTAEPRLYGPVSGLSVASIRGARHAILLVSDLEGRELSQLSSAVSVPMVDQLVIGLSRPVSHATATLAPDTAVERLLRRRL